LKALRKFIPTTLNGLFPLFHSVHRFLDPQSEKSNARYEGHFFNRMLFRDYNIIETEDDDGINMRLVCNERDSVYREITWLLKSLG
jgi:hypothetical protein